MICPSARIIMDDIGSFVIDTPTIDLYAKGVFRDIDVSENTIAKVVQEWWNQVLWWMNDPTACLLATSDDGTKTYYRYKNGWFEIAGPK